MSTHDSPPVPRHRPHRPVWSSLAVAALLLAACGGDDDDSAADGNSSSADAPASQTDPQDGGGGSTTMPVSEETAESPDAGSSSGESLGYGTGSATVTYGDEVHRFVIEEEAESIMDLQGRCQELFGILSVDLPLVESNGTAVPEGSGSLNVDIELDGDIPDFEPYVQIMVPGGHWVAGASETASGLGVETPNITLEAGGMSVTGTQAMVPLVVGPGEPIDATIELTCG